MLDVIIIIIIIIIIPIYCVQGLCPMFHINNESGGNR